MKRILSVLLALVMVIGMLPMSILTASAADTTATLSFANKAQRTSFSSTSQVWEQNGITFTNNKAASTNAVADYAKPVRLYANSEIIVAIAGGNITKIVVNANNATYATALKNSVGAEATVSDKVVTITPNATATSYTIAKLTAQVRLDSINVTYQTIEAGACAHANTVNVAAVAATCTAVGYTAGVQCTDCNVYIEGHEQIDALGHAYGDFAITTEATCTTAGAKTQTCANGCGVDIVEEIPATGHTYVDGVCACGASQADVVSYKEVTTDDITAGKYIIAGQRAALSYPNVYPATGTCSGDWTVVENAVAVNDGVITSDMFSGAQVFVLEGDKDTGFTIGYHDGTEMVYLGVSSYTENRKMAFSADYSNIRWKLGTAEKNGYSLSHSYDGGTYAVSDNSTGTGSIRGYKSGATYYGIYLFKEVAGDVVDPDVPTEPTDPVEPTDPSEPETEPTVPETEPTEPEVTEPEVEPSEPETPATQWMLVTDAGSLAAGDQIVIVASGFDVALSTEQKSNNRGQIAITKDGNVVEINDSVQILTLEAGTISDTWAFNAGSGYLYAAGGTGKNNYLKTQTTKTDAGSFTVEISAEGVATIKAPSSVARNWMRYNDASSLFSCYGSGQKDISIYKLTTVDGCVHTIADDAWEIVTAATCETAGSKTGTCSKCGETVTKEISALGHNYIYNAETEKMVCANNCGNSFMNTIAEAKNFTDNTTVYYMKGIVTYVSGQTVYMQDETGGICVYFTDADNAAGIAVGDELLVWDTVKNYKGLIETDYTKSSEVQVLSSGNELPVREITIAELNADTSNEYLAERIKITGATIGMINSSGNTTLTVGTDTTNLYKASGLAANVSENDIVDVIAIVGCYNAYQLLVNPGTAATDVVVTTEGVPSDLPVSDISAAKAGTAGEFFKVKGIVTFVDGASVYMQDATAGIVARLATGVTAPAIGTEIEVIGAYDVYYGLIQLEGATFETVSTGNTVAAKEVTLADLANNTYLSEKVSLKKLEITAVGTYNSTYKNVDYTVSDGTNTIKLYRAPLADEANKLAVGDVVNVIAVLSTYDGYQLRVVAESDITKAKPVAMVGDVEYTSFEAAVAAANGAEIKLLADIELSELTLNANINVDVNGHVCLVEGVAGAYTVTVKDSATANYKTLGVLVNFVGDDVVLKAADGYLMTEEENGDGYFFDAYKLAITHVSLDANKDALGYKAELKGNAHVQAAVTGYGFTMGVNKKAQTVTASGPIDDGVFTLRLYKIMATNGGEKEINATAFVIFNGDDENAVTTGQYTTTMKKTILDVNDMFDDLSAEQKAAVQKLYSEYEPVIAKWLEGKINNFAPVSNVVPSALEGTEQ